MDSARTNKVKAPEDSAEASRDQEGHIVRSARVRIKTSRVGREEVHVDTARTGKVEDLEGSVRARTKTSRAGKVEVPVDTVKVSRVQEDHIVRLVRVRTKISRAVRVKAPVDSARATRVEVLERAPGVLDAGT